jgi:two-component system response regulator TctD
MRILVIEDNDELAKLLVRGLQAASFSADLAGTAEEAEAALKAVRYAAIVLDLGLPDRDGTTVLKGMRARKDATPVLVLTARSGVHDRVAGLQAGADDYLVKPFAFEELAARLRALLRRPGDMLGRVLQVNNLQLDTEARQVFVDGEPQVMSAQELALLEILMRRGGKVVSKRHMEDHLFGLTSEVGPNAVEVSVHRLRKRLGKLGATVDVHTIRGVGYLLGETPA